MKLLRKLMQEMSWQSLTISLALFAGVIFYITENLFTALSNQYVLALFLLGIGLVGIVAGYMITQHVKFELFPKPIQIIGSLLVGLAVSAILYSGLSVISTQPEKIGFLLLFISILFFAEFLTVRIAQSKTITIPQLVAIGLLVFIALTNLKSFPEVLQNAMGLFLGAGIIALIISRLTDTYLLSPWVNSFWHGWALFAAGLLLIPLTSTDSVILAIEKVLVLPLWLGLVIGFLALSVLAFRQLKHKFRISKGYMQYKLQLLTGLLALVALLFGGFDTQLIVGFILVIVAYSVSEKRLVIKE